MKIKNYKFLVMLFTFMTLNFGVNAQDVITFTWQTTGGTEKNFYIQATYGKSFTVDWGDSQVEPKTGDVNIMELSHTYAATSNRTVTITAGTDCRFTYLVQDGCGIVNLNVSGATVLTHLGCYNNPPGNSLSGLDLSQNTALTTLLLHNNHLSSLPTVSANTALKVLWCNNNNLTLLDLDGNAALTDLYCYNNPLDALNLSANTGLTRLWCSYNQLTDLDLSANTGLKYLYYYNNELSSLGGVNSAVLEHLYSYNNHLQLSELYDAHLKIPNQDNKHMGTQRLAARTVRTGIPVAFTPDQSIFNGTYTAFAVEKNDAPASSADYAVTNGHLTFNEPGGYVVTMTNGAIVSHTTFPAKVIIPFTVVEPVFQIWNWEDLAKLKYYTEDATGIAEFETLYSSKAMLMQNLTASSAGGDTWETPDAAHAGAKANGWYGYQMSFTFGGSFTTGWHGTEGWMPIGNQTTRFTGEFDGNNKAISGLWIKRENDDCQGLFGVIYEATITDLGVNITDEVKGQSRVGGLVGLIIYKATINGCYTTGTVNGTGVAVGGLIGYVSGDIGDIRSDVQISDCYSSANVTSTLTGGSSMVGGFLGYIEYSTTVTNCHATGNVSGMGNCNGGFLGCVYGATMTDCYASGTVTGGAGTIQIGGLIGNAMVIDITNCYATGNVNGDNDVGGLIGWAHTNVNVTNSYVTGNVTGNSHVGKFVGLANTTTFTNCYYDKTGTVIPAVGNGSDTGITGLETWQMTRENPTTEMTGFTFPSVWVWKANDGTTGYYPQLKVFESSTNNTIKDASLASVIADAWYKVDFDPNTGTLSGATPVWIKNNTASSAAPIATKQGYEFKSWNTAANGSGTTYTPGTTSVGATDWLVYAQWVSLFAPNSEGVFEIWNWEDLAHVMYIQATYPAATFKVMQNIGVSTIPGSFDTWATPDDNHQGDKAHGWYGYNQSFTAPNGNTVGFHATEGWIPIGSYFSKTFNGNNKVITGLWINRAGAVQSQGLFGSTSNATITNLGVNIVGDVKGSTTGGLIGYSATTNITGCWVTGNVSGSSITGGLVGHSTTSNITSCWVTGNVSGSSTTGGLIGYSSTTNITGCWVTGDVSGSSRTGGLAGHMYVGSLKNSYAIGSVSGTSQVGGLVGEMDNNVSTGTCMIPEGCPPPPPPAGAVVENCYAIGTIVSTGNMTGGLVGYLVQYCQIRSSYASANVNGNTNAGEFAGSVSSATLTNCYYDKTDKTLPAVGSGSASGITGLETCQMTRENAITNMTGLNFTSVWDTTANNGVIGYYPQLRVFAENTNPTIVAASLASVETNACYKVDFDPNTGTLSGATPVWIKNNTASSAAPTATKQGSEFKSWNTAANGSGTTYTPGTTSVGTTDWLVYAQWCETPVISSFTYPGAQPYYINDSDLKTPTVNGSNHLDGSYTATGGLIIDSSTGAITPSENPANSYTVTYTIAAAGGCSAVTETATVIIANPTGCTISYPLSGIYCGNDATLRTPSLSGAGCDGGTYSATGGLDINSTTGALTPNENTANSYTVSYTVAGNVVATATVTIKPNLSSDMLTVRDTTICSGESVEICVVLSSTVTNPVYRWYRSATGGETHLIGTDSCYTHASDLGSVSGATPYIYYVTASGDNYCEGSNSLDGRKPVIVTVKAISGPKDITISGITGVCGTEGTTLEASAPNVLNPVFRWYSNAEGGTPFYVGHEYKTSALKADTTFYVSVSGSNYCEGSVRDTVEIFITCFTVHGTVFPLVFIGDDEIDAVFTIEAKLYAPPPPNTADPIAYLRRVAPLHDTIAVHYNGSVYVPGTPRNPGYSGSLINPGAPIIWEIINKIPDLGMEKDTTTLRPGEEAAISVGHYTFENVAPGNYVLTLSRPGFITRYAKVTVVSGGTPFIEHRELIGGDVNNDMRIDPLDINAINYRLGYTFGDGGYDARYDINGNTEIEIGDISLVKFFQGFHIEGYEDTSEWLKEYNQD